MKVKQNMGFLPALPRRRRLAHGAWHAAWPAALTRADQGTAA